MSDLQSILEGLRAADVPLYLLTRAVSPAVIVEPELMRMMRLALFPNMEAGVEADLWFSPLVQAYSPQALVLEPQAIQFLRQDLQDHPDVLDRAWQVILEVHKNAAQAIRLEEEVVYLALKGGAEAGEAIDILLGSAVQALGPDRTGLARWVLRALPNLPERARVSSQAYWLELKARLLLGHVSLGAVEGETKEIDRLDVEVVLNTLPRMAVGVRLLSDGVEFAEPPQEDMHKLEVPETDSVWLEVTWEEDGHQRVEPINLSRGQRRTVKAAGASFRLRNLLGEEYRLKPRSIGPSQPERVDELNLSGHQLRELPVEIFSRINLKHINLSNNILTSISPEINQLSLLETLILDENQLQFLPAEISQLINLRELRVRNNLLSDLPTDFTRMANLEKLDLHGNKLNRLSFDISSLTRLRHLDLSRNELVELPAVIGQLSKLEILRLDYNMLSDLPNGIGQLVNLRELNIRNNKLIDLPHGIRQLANLKQLDLQDNLLHIPLEILVNVRSPTNIINFYFESLSPSTATSHTYLTMGAIPYPSSTAFRVWAPNADKVYLVGDFNDWSEKANPLERESDGYWYTEISGATIGDEYKYAILNSDQVLWRIDPYAKEVAGSQGNSVIYDPTFDWGAEAFQMPYLNELVVYEAHIGTFNDQPGGPPGDLTRAIERFPYLQELGINAIQLMPIMEFPGAFSWGYDPAHIFAVESDYGGAEAFKNFVKAAHAHGFAVIFDVVYNHLGPGDLVQWQFDGWQENGKGGIYFYNDWRSATPWGETRPDYGREEVRQYLRNNALMWLESYKVDGLRWDATAYISNVYGNSNDPEHDLADGWSLMQWINTEIKSRQPGKISIAEDLRTNSAITAEQSSGGAGFDAQWDVAFVHPIRKAIITSDDQARDMDAVRQAIEHRYNTDAFQRVIYTESHDEVANGKARVPQEILPEDPGSYISKKRSTLGAALVFTSPGIPMIFQGQEFLEDEWFRDTDPIDWTKAETYSGILHLYRDLISLRRNLLDTTRGLRGQGVNVHHVNRLDKVIAFHRWENGGPRDDVIVVVNMANQSYESYNLGFPRPGLWRERFNSDSSDYDPDFGNLISDEIEVHEGVKDGMPFQGTVGLGPYSVIILSQDD